MASNWGSFLQGLSHTTQQLPSLMQRNQALQLQNEEIQRREKQLGEAMKKQEINEAQQSLYKGLEWSEKLSDDVKPQIIDSMIVPAIKTLTKHNIMSYNDEQVQEFATKLKGNVTVGSQFMKDFKNIIDLNTDKKTGSVNYKEILKGIDMLLPTYGKKLTENEMKVAEVQKQNVARQGMADSNVPAEDKPLIGSYLPANAQKAFGIGDEAKISDFAVFYRGYKENNPKATESEISDAWGKEQAKRAAQKIQVSVNARGGDLTPDAIKQEGIKYALTGKMPAMGMGNPILRSKIMNAAAEYYKENGIDPMSIPQLQADYTASNAALTKATKDFTAIKGFEEGMIKNMDYAVRLSKEFGNTKYPLANTLINAFKTQTGDPKIVEFANAIYAAAMEYEKIRTAGTGITSAELSVNAQAKAEKLINTSQNHAQLLGAQKAMLTDAKNISNARNKQLHVLRNSIKTQSPAFGESGGGEKDPLGIR